MPVPTTGMTQEQHGAWPDFPAPRFQSENPRTWTRLWPAMNSFLNRSQTHIAPPVRLHELRARIVHDVDDLDELNVGRYAIEVSHLLS